MPSPISPADDTNPIQTRRGRAWIDRAAGVRIGYTFAGISPGTSKTVLLIHGAPQTGYAWRKVVPTLVAAGYQVVVPDYRGAGASTKPRWWLRQMDHGRRPSPPCPRRTRHRRPVVDRGTRSWLHGRVRLRAAVPRRCRQPDHHGSAAARHRVLRATQGRQERLALRLPRQPRHRRVPDPRSRALVHHPLFDDLTNQPDAISQDDLDVYARAFEAPGAMRALCEIYRELDHDADIHRADIAAHGKLTVPVLASGGAAQTLAANYASMCEEIAMDVTGHLVPDAGHWVAEENPDYF